jgi:hypothetical protein
MMIADRLYQISGVETPLGQRHVQVRIMTGAGGQEFQLNELYLIRANGDWDYVDSTNADVALGWLIGDEG